jgi:hypothetical protein
MSRRGKALIYELGDSWSFGQLSLLAKILWPMLLPASDDQGRGRAHAKYIKWSICQNVDELTIENIPDVLKELEQQGMLYLYGAGGEQYYQVINWWDHQQMTWAHPSKYPAPVGWVDRIRYNAKGNEQVKENWGKSGGFTNGVPSSDEAPTQVDTKVDTSKEPKQHNITQHNTTEDTMGATPHADLPHNHDEWLQFIRAGKDQKGGCIARVGRMLVTLWPEIYNGGDPPYSKIGGVARNVGGAARLGQLLWKANASKVTGDPLDYASKMHSYAKKHSNGKSAYDTLDFGD